MIKATSVAAAATIANKVAGAISPEGAVAVSKRFQGKVALITGAAQGLGRETAVQFAAQGADVAICDICEQLELIKSPMGTEFGLTETKRLIEAQGRRCLAIKADVRKMDQMRSFVEKCIADLGQIDFVIANAGVALLSEMLDMSDEEWNVVVDTNLTGVANTLRAVLPHLKERKAGRIVAVSSAAGETGMTSLSAYVASKWGVIGLTKTAALEMGPFNITVNAVCPTALRTPMRTTRPDLAGKQARKINVLKPMHALPVEVLEPKAIADAITFLCSDEATFISGMPLDVQAGGNARNVT
jgi:SDR family mycofactocin-dependent oxidoreductase